MGGLEKYAAVLCFVLFSLVAVEALTDRPHQKRHNDDLTKNRKYLSKSINPYAAGDDLRLPSALSPTNYLIRLQPMIGGNFTTYGYIEIDFDCLEATDVVMFHMMDIVTKNETIELVDVTADTVPLTFASHDYNLTKQVYIGTLDAPLAANSSYRISMEFEGYLSKDLGGFYRSSYIDANGTEVLLATTQMEVAEARRAFPCFDEPSFKATFNVEMLRQLPRETISNMPRIDTREDDDQPGWYWDIFDTSPIMSSYLVAFVVSDFEYIERNTTDGRVLFKIWARPTAIDQTDYALLDGPDILSFFESYYGIDFPLPKQDMIAIPDFLGGAMENWGLITYREYALLYDPIESTASTKQHIDIVMAHELAHQWFGDLVTMEWWSDIWLNEGFAAYMEYLGVNAVRPEYGIFDSFGYVNMQYVFHQDSNMDSHPVYQEISTSNQFSISSNLSIFDAITYQKGSSVIRMMRYFLTESTFRQALHNYLTDYSYSNADHDNLWEHMTAQAVIDGTLNQTLTVKKVMDTWIQQTGYPLLEVTINGDGTASLEQARYLQTADPNMTNYNWWIPLTWTSGENPTFDRTGVDDWMSNIEPSKEITGLSTTATWFLFNVDQMGYFRVNYDVQNWQGITDQLTFDKDVVSILSRSQLIDDSMNLARALPPRVDYTVPLSLINYMSTEFDYVPWVTALDNLDYLEKMLTDTTGYGNIRHFLLTIMTPVYQSVGFSDSLTDLHLTQLTRRLIVDWVCHLDETTCVDSAVALYAQFMAEPDNNPVSPNSRDSVYCTAIAHGGIPEWDHAWDQFLKAEVETEKDNLLNAMGCSRYTYILSRYLDRTYLTANSSVMRSDQSRVWRAVSENDFGNRFAQEYLNHNWDDMADYFGSYSSLAGLMDIVAAEYNTVLERKLLETFKAERADYLGSSVATIDGSIERTNINIAWMDSHYDLILSWFVEQGY